MERLKESELHQYVLEIFEKENFKGFYEVKAGQKKIDLYFIHQNYPRTIAVELKINKWKSALRQAYQNCFYAQKSYVGLWHKSINDDVLDLANNLNIGVIKIVDKEAKIILDPKIRYFGFTYSTKKILQQLTEKSSEFLWVDDNL